MDAIKKFLLIVAFVIIGSFNTLVTKFEFQTCSTGLEFASVHPNCPEGQKTYQKPWTQNLCMFIAEASLYILYVRKQRRRRLMMPDLSEPMKGNRNAECPMYIFLLPASCDVLATGLGAVGLLMISASVWQMMRGSLIIFTSIFSVVCLGRKLYAYNYVAVTTACVGLGLVGLSAMLDENSESSNVSVGIIITVGAQAFTGLQCVMEELFVKKYRAPVEQCVGSEGIWGICIMIVLLTIMYNVPGRDSGSFENVFDSTYMLYSNPTLLFLVFGYILSIGSYNFIGLTIAKELSAVHRTMNDSLRTAAVWGVQLLLFTLGNHTYGVGWKAHSWMQLLGFVMLVLGSLINHMILKLPFLFYPDEIGARLRTMGNVMSPTAQGVSILSYPGSPGCSPVPSPQATPPRQMYEDEKVDLSLVEIED